MFSIEIECPQEQNDMLVAEVWAEGSAGIVEMDGGRLRAFFEDDASLEALAARFHAVSSRQEPQLDWVAMSRANWEPLRVGERFFLVPEWRDDPAPEGRFRIAVNPGMAFGTGRHETTQLCLEALETYVRPGVPAYWMWARARVSWRKRRHCWAPVPCGRATSIRRRWR